MADPRRHYFVATGPDAQALLANIVQMHQAHIERTSEYVQRYGAKLIMQVDGFPTGILLDLGAPVPEGFKFRQNTRHAEAEYQLCAPVGNTKAGRAAKAAAAEVGRFSASEMITKHYGVHGHWLIVGGNMSWHPTGWASEAQSLITLQVPATHESPLPKLHPELREIDYSQYVAITEEGAPAPPEASTLPPPGGAWIACADRMPPDETPVPIMLNGDLRLGELRWDHPGHEDTYQSYRYWDDPKNDGQCWDMHRVTHWYDFTATAPAPLWRYTCKGKGGEYELLGLAKGAGKSKLVTDLQVYRDVATGHLYFRDPEDFDNRMERIA